VSEFKKLADRLDRERFCLLLQDGNMVRGYFDRVPTVFLRVNKGRMATCLLSTTGGAEENARLRNIAKVMGYRLVSDGLYDSNGNLIETPTERDIYEKLGEKYKEPTER
jgi:DNA polymerase/3'-5' exonuclease PolX